MKLIKPAHETLKRSGSRRHWQLLTCYCYQGDKGRPGECGLSNNGTHSPGLWLRHVLIVNAGRQCRLGIGWPDLQHVLLTSILWPVNRRALWESIIPPPPMPQPPTAVPHHVIALSGSELHNDPCGDPLLHQYIPIYHWIPTTFKNTASPNMPLSPGFPW